MDAGASQAAQLDEIVAEHRKWFTGENMPDVSTSNGNKIKAVILDYGEVLCHRPLRQEFQRMEATFGVGPEAFAELWMRNRMAFDRGDLTPEAYWAQLGEDASHPISSAQIAEMKQLDLDMWSRDNQIMVNWMRSLRSHRIKVGVLSNMHSEMVANVRNRFAWLNEFDFLTFSAEVRMAKPDAEIYEHTLRGMNVEAQESLFVDDRAGNIQAAKALGMTAIQFESVEQFRKELETLKFSVLL
jgi:putative hydrolase of the HAD superfamily